MTEFALINRIPFDRSGSHGFSMRAIEGKTSSQGYMPWDEWVKYRDAEVTYTVFLQHRYCLGSE